MSAAFACIMCGRADDSVPIYRPGSILPAFRSIHYVASGAEKYVSPLGRQHSDTLCSGCRSRIQRGEERRASAADRIDNLFPQNDSASLLGTFSQSLDSGAARRATIGGDYTGRNPAESMTMKIDELDLQMDERPGSYHPATLSRAPPLSKSRSDSALKVSSPQR